jgi:hypothetical protein
VRPEDRALYEIMAMVIAAVLVAAVCGLTT